MPFAIPAACFFTVWCGFTMQRANHGNDEKGRADATAGVFEHSRALFDVWTPDLQFAFPAILLRFFHALFASSGVGVMFVVGIDPGTHTGFAVWSIADQRLIRMDTLKIHRALFTLAEMHAAEQIDHVVYENARLRTWFGSHSAQKDRQKLQGAGSIKRDCTILEDFLTDQGIPHVAVKPQAGGTKWTAERFARVTGWAGRTNEHARDAALLVLGRKRLSVQR